MGQFDHVNDMERGWFSVIKQTLSLDARRQFGALIKQLAQGRRGAPDKPILVPHHLEHCDDMIFDLVGLDKPVIKFQAVGCQGAEGSGLAQLCQLFGTNDNAQVGVAKLMSDIPEIDFKLLLGDNFYMNGVNTVGSDKFYDAFYKLYPGLCLVALGNHDWTAHGARKSTRIAAGWNTSIEVAYNQVFQTYHTRGGNLKSCNVSGDWQMPFRYYMVRHELFNIYVIDSSSIAFDPIQQIWLVNTIKEQAALAPEKFNILVTHHPLLYYGKRRTAFCEWGKYEKVIKEDTGVYQEPTIYVKDGAPVPIVKGDPRHSNIGKILQSILVLNNLHEIDLAVTAHEHDLIASRLTFEFADGNIKQIYQVISGGGGAQRSNIKYTDLPDNAVAPDTEADPAYEQEEIATAEGAEVSANPLDNRLLRADPLFQAQANGYFQFELSKDEVKINVVLAARSDLAASPSFKHKIKERGRRFIQFKKLELNQIRSFSVV